MTAAHAYALYKMLFGLAIGFTMTTYTPFLSSIGVSLAEISLVNAWYMGTVWLMELPTGMLADGKSRIWSVRVGMLVHVGTGICYFYANDIVWAIVAEVIAGLASAFTSGADQAWLVDALRAEGKSEDEDRQKAMATAFAGVTCGMVVGGVIGGYVGEIDLRLPWLMMAATNLAAYLTSRRFMTHCGEPQGRISERQAFVRSMRSLRVNRALIWAVTLTLVSVLMIPFNLFWAIFFRFDLGQGGVGLLWVPLYGTMALVGFVLRSRRIKWRRAHLASGMLGVAGASLAIAGIYQSLPITLMFLMIHEAGRGFSEIMIDTYVQGKVDSSHRATFGSLRSFIRSSCSMIVLGLFWFYGSNIETTQENIVLVWLVSGMVMTVCASLLWLIRPSD